MSGACRTGSPGPQRLESTLACLIGAVPSEGRRGQSGAVGAAVWSSQLGDRVRSTACTEYVEVVGTRRKKKKRRRRTWDLHLAKLGNTSREDEQVGVEVKNGFRGVPGQKAR